MDRYTKDTKKWLDDVAWARANEGIYIPHQPIYGFNDLRCGLSRRAFWCYPITYNILRSLKERKCEIRRAIDIGCGEGYLANQVRGFIGASTIVADLSHTAIKRARQIYNLNGVVVDIHKLPFKDKCFDLVMCTEVIEHLTDPPRAVDELKRISNSILLITTPLAHSQGERDRYFAKQDPNEPHKHLQFFTEQEICELLGSTTTAWGCDSSFLNLIKALLSVDFNIKSDALKRHTILTVAAARLIKWLSGRVRKIIGNFLYVKLVILMDAVFSRIFQKSTGILLAIKDCSPREGLQKRNRRFVYNKDIFRHMLLDSSVKEIRIGGAELRYSDRKAKDRNVESSAICAVQDIR